MTTRDVATRLSELAVETVGDDDEIDELESILGGSGSLRQRVRLAASYMRSMHNVWLQTAWLHTDRPYNSIHPEAVLIALLPDGTISCVPDTLPASRVELIYVRRVP